VLDFFISHCHACMSNGIKKIQHFRAAKMDF